MYQGARRLAKPDSPKGDGPRLSGEERVEGGTDGAGVEQILVPSYCPVRPFERYVALHHDIFAGKAPPRYDAVALCSRSKRAVVITGKSACGINNWLSRQNACYIRNP